MLRGVDPQVRVHPGVEEAVHGQLMDRLSGSPHRVKVGLSREDQLVAGQPLLDPALATPCTYSPRGSIASRRWFAARHARSNYPRVEEPPC